MVVLDQPQTDRNGIGGDSGGGRADYYFREEGPATLEEQSGSGGHSGSFCGRGPAEYQDDVRSAAYKHVKDFSVAIDVGANIGFWTKPLSVKFKKIFAFEPVQNVFDCLKKNTENLNIVYHQFVVSDRESYVDMIVDTVNTGNNIVDTNSFDTGKIYVNKLDNMNLPKFGLIKVDCQGHDYFVLAGAKETLKKYKPILKC